MYMYIHCEHLLSYMIAYCTRLIEFEINIYNNDGHGINKIWHIILTLRIKHTHIYSLTLKITERGQIMNVKKNCKKYN